MTIVATRECFLEELRMWCDSQMRLAALLPRVANALAEPEVAAWLAREHAAMQADLRIAETLFARLGVPTGECKCAGMEGIAHEIIQLLHVESGMYPSDCDHLLLAGVRKAFMYQIATLDGLLLETDMLDSPDLHDVIQRCRDHAEDACEYLVEEARRLALV